MPVQKSKSALFAKYGGRLDSAVRDHAADETDYGGMSRLPPGIINGVAQLTDCRFEQYKEGTKMKKADGTSAAGEYFFLARAVVVEPETVVHNGQVVKVAGGQTTCQVGGISPPVFDTKSSTGKVKTQEEWIADILNEMRKLGADTAGVGGSDLEGLAAALAKVKPYFRINTSQGQVTPQYPTPRVWENWDGTRGLEDYVPPEAGGVSDSTAAPAAHANGRAVGVGNQPAGRSGTAPSAAKFDEFGDLDSLVDLASSADPESEDAQTKLLEMAAAAGHADEARDAEDWTAVASLIRGGGAPGAGASAVGEHAYSEGDVCVYLPIDPKTKNPVGKGHDVQILTSNRKARTATLKDLGTGRPVLDPKTKKALVVSWDLLELSD